MSKNTKKIVLGITIPAAIAGAIVGGLFIYRNASAKPVPVYPLEQLVMTDYESDMATTSGTVSAEGIQKVFITGSQTVGSVDVKEGQEVKKGDVLISYDTTLSDVEVERARVGVERLNLELDRARKELEELNNAQPHTTIVIEPGYTVEYKPVETPKLLRGSGTSEDPYIYLFDENDSITGSLLKNIMERSKKDSSEKKSEEEDDPVNAEDDAESVYVVIINRENNAMNAQITARRGVRIDISDGAISGIGFFEPHIPEDIERYEEQPEAREEERGSEYTQEDLVRLRAEKAGEIDELKRSIALAKNDYEMKKLEVEDNVVRAKTDGVVTRVRTPQEASSENAAVVELSAGGSYFVTGTINEFDLENVHVGDMVTVESYGMSDGGGGSYEGEIVEISDTPASEDEASAFFYSGEGNSNATYYPFKVRLSADLDLRDDSYLEIKYEPDSEAENGVYIMNAFIKRDGADSYVYVRGENGRLEKKSVSTGRSLWGSYTLIKGGLKSDDMLAFPYGKDAKQGSATKESSLEEAYGDMPSY